MRRGCSLRPVLDVLRREYVLLSQSYYMPVCVEFGLHSWVRQHDIENVLAPADVIAQSRDAMSLRLLFYPDSWHGIGLDIRHFINANVSDSVQLSLLENEYARQLNSSGSGVN